MTTLCVGIVCAALGIIAGYCLGYADAEDKRRAKQ